MPEVGDLITVRINATLDGQPIINDFSFALISPSATWNTTALVAANALDAALGLYTGGGLWTARLVSEYLVGSIDVLDVSPGTQPMVSLAASAQGEAGVNAGLPPNDCICMTLRSDFRGPSGRGRAYISGLAKADTINGFWTSDAQTYAQAIGQALIDGFGEEAPDATMRWCVIHKISGGAPLVPPETKPIMSFTVRNNVRSLSRRAMGRRIGRRTTPTP